MTSTAQQPRPPQDGEPALLRVAVAAPLSDLFDYLAPPAGPVPEAGTRVLVPLGQGRRIGLVTARADHSTLDPARLKPITQVLDPAPILAGRDLELLLWAARYYHCPPGEAVFSALPARLRRPVPAADPPRRGWRPAMNAPEPALAARARRQRAVLDLLRAHPEGITDDLVRAQLGDCAAALRALERKRLIERCTAPAVAHREAAEPALARLADPPRLNPEQRAAIDAVEACRGFGCFVLDGVTGSGKTEVYLHLVAAALARGRRALVLVPEIGLTPQLAERLAQRLDAPLAVLHSGLAEQAREQAWRRAATGVASLVLGTRSAVFTPLQDLGLIVVDEEHDASLKQQDGFRYSARDLAVRRAQLADCPVVLGSATPSLETLRNARLGRYRHLHLRRRAGSAAAPRVRLVDIRAQPLQTGLSHALLTRAEEALAAGDQVLLFLNRRGFSPVLTCHDCGWISACRHCDARMTLHRGRGVLICHHCGDSQPLPTQCPYCESPDLRPLGQGTERVEDTLRQRFPGLPIARIDRDSTRRKGELERLLTAARDGAYPILLGTQMLAKGHHLPGITLVGVLDLDHGLYGTDFRAAERMAQLLVQVAGRAGRAERPGTVLVQTRHPRHPLLARLLRQGYAAFADAALAERAEARLPPFSHQVLVRADSRQEREALAFLRSARDLAQPLAGTAAELWGPAPASMERRAGRYRAQLLLQAPQRRTLHRLLDALLPRLRSLKAPRGLRWGVDVDPQDGL